MIKKDEQREQILTRSTGYLFRTLCIPGIIGMVVIALYSFMDSVYAGKMISEQAMASQEAIRSSRSGTSRTELSSQPQLKKIAPSPSGYYL